MNMEQVLAQFCKVSPLPVMARIAIEPRATSFSTPSLPRTPSGKSLASFCFQPS